MRLYHWSSAAEPEQRASHVRVPSAFRRAGGVGFTAVPLSTERPRGAAQHYVGVDIPRRVAEPYRIAPGHYLLPASVVRAYRARSQRRRPLTSR